jgi:two-component system response regulator YesN
LVCGRPFKAARGASKGKPITGKEAEGVENLTEELKLAADCIRSFSKVTGLGALLCFPDGNVAYETGYSCRSCTLCQRLHVSGDVCVVSRAKGWHEANRFGGKYTYSCPMGLTCIATPVEADSDTLGNVTVGPFLMVDEEDLLQCELSEYLNGAPALRGQALEALGQAPRIAPDRAEAIAQQLFLSVGGIGNACSIAGLLDQQHTDYLMGELTFVTNENKAAAVVREYPVSMEREFLAAIVASDRQKAEKLLNELLGNIFFLTGKDFARIRSRVLELMVLASRAAIEGGADPDSILALTSRCVDEMQDLFDIDKLCYWLTRVLRQFFECLFQQQAGEGRLMLPKILSYIQKNCQRRITLEEMSRIAHLSPSYFSRMFAKETGMPLSAYVTTMRINRAKGLLREGDMTLTQIAIQSGFCDQSHFTKAFRAQTGVTPGYYRKHRRGYSELPTKSSYDES